MHCLYGLQKKGFKFELKGGTSLSKGYGIIHRFSEDIDIRIEPPSGRDIKTDRNHTKPAHCEGRKNYYDWLAKRIKIDGINDVLRDTAFDNEKYFSGGIRLCYTPAFPIAAGLKEGILLEVGFDDVMPNQPMNISSWILDSAQAKGIAVEDNKAHNVLCYHPGYTFVEKLQTITTKFRQQKKKGTIHPDFIRHYYDVACLLENDLVQDFIGTTEYKIHKKKRFPAVDLKIPLSQNEAFLLKDTRTKEQYKNEYAKSSALYYQGRPSFDEILNTISKNLDEL